MKIDEEKVRKNRSIVCHYTSLDALVKILHKDYICFWGTRYDSMNDPTDSIYGKDVVLPLVRDAINNAGLDDYEKDELESYPYVVSFSENYDDFIMWRMYKADVALVFNRDKIAEYVIADKSESFVYFENCEYSDNEDELCRMFCEKMNVLNNGQGLMLAAHHSFVFFKRKEFENEKEVRLVKFDHEGFYVDGINSDKPLFVENEIPDNIGVRAIRNNDLILYKEFHLPKVALTGIIVNCKNDSHYERLKSHIRLWLNNQGYEQSINIEKSVSGNFINF